MVPVVGKFAAWVYRRLRQRYGGACNPSNSAEVDEIELPAQSSLTIPQFRMETPRDAKGMFLLVEIICAG